MFKSDRASIIMLAVNVGVPLVLLVTVVALMFRQMILVLRRKPHWLRPRQTNAPRCGALPCVERRFDQLRLRSFLPKNSTATSAAITAAATKAGVRISWRDRPKL
jgi:hypothetical protein